MNNKDIEEIKIKKTYTQINPLNLVKFLHTNNISSKALHTKYNYNKLFLEKDIKHKYSTKKYSPYLQAKKINFEKLLKNIKIQKNSRNCQKCEKNDNSKIKKEINFNNKKNVVNIKNTNNKENKIIIDLYGQSLDLSIMRERPPKIPEMFYNPYISINKKILFKENNSYGVIKKDKLPNAFFNHFLLSDNKYKFHNRYNYNKIFITQRNKNKLLTIIYLSP